jgi:hypothetical protein
MSELNVGSIVAMVVILATLAAINRGCERHTEIMKACLEKATPTECATMERLRTQ